MDFVQQVDDDDDTLIYLTQLITLREPILLRQASVKKKKCSHNSFVSVHNHHGPLEFDEIRYIYLEQSLVD